MKVKELIAKLQEFDGELEVIIYNSNKAEGEYLEKVSKDSWKVYLEFNI